ncbi:MAG: hypothetical protein IKM12_00190 [Alistipes sp.]|nr:hypothetical protein [Alistipes sp.]
MKSLLSTFAYVVAILLIAGCAARRVSKSNVEQDSVYVDVREAVEYVTDTVEVEIPLIIERNITLDTISHLENDYAISEAIVNGGILAHTLQTKPQLRQVQIKTPRLRKDSIIYQSFYRDAEIEVERELSWLQKLQVNGFWGILIIVLICIVFRWGGRE